MASHGWRNGSFWCTGYISVLSHSKRKEDPSPSGRLVDIARTALVVVQLPLSHCHCGIIIIVTFLRARHRTRGGAGGKRRGCF